MDDPLKDSRKTLLALMNVTRRDWQIRPRHWQHAHDGDGMHYPWPTARRQSAAPGNGLRCIAGGNRP